MIRDETDGTFVATGRDENSDNDLQQAENTTAAVNTRLTSKKLKIDARTGSVKVQGVKKDSQTHKYFDETEGGETEQLSSLAHIAKQMREAEDDDEDDQK